MIRLLFTASDDLIPRIIRRHTWSTVSHVAIQINDTVYESSHSTGVVGYTYNEWLQLYGKPVEVRYLFGLDEKQVERRLRSQLGGDYNFALTFLFPLRLDFRKNLYHLIEVDDLVLDWNCSELIAWAIREIIAHDYFYRVAPRHLLAIGHASEHTLKMVDPVQFSLVQQGFYHSTGVSI